MNLITGIMTDPKCIQYREAAHVSEKPYSIRTWNFTEEPLPDMRFPLLMHMHVLFILDTSAAAAFEGVAAVIRQQISGANPGAHH